MSQDTDEEIAAEVLVRILRSVPATETSEDCIARIDLDEDLQRSQGDALVETQRIGDCLALGWCTPSGTKAQLKRGDARAIVRGQASNQGRFGVEETTVGGEQPDGLGVEHWVAFFVYAFANEEER